MKKKDVSIIQAEIRRQTVVWCNGGSVRQIFISKNMLDMFHRPYKTEANERINNIIEMLALKWKYTARQSTRKPWHDCSQYQELGYE